MNKPLFRRNRRINAIENGQVRSRTSGGLSDDLGDMSVDMEGVLASVVVVDHDFNDANGFMEDNWNRLHT